MKSKSWLSLRCFLYTASYFLIVIWLIFNDSFWFSEKILFSLCLSFIRNIWAHFDETNYMTDGGFWKIKAKRLQENAKKGFIMTVFHRNYKYWLFIIKDHTKIELLPLLTCFNKWHLLNRFCVSCCPPAGRQLSDVTEDTCAPTDVPVIMGQWIVIF